ncbi:HD domain-containing protein [Mangrovibacillus cuniculi]|uniref:HD domain-containing protein n=1 Tax=Mangrovibacillus cuniculi TaxID=2593652 RepID=A0A7S8CAY3_9BACI|nr:HD domain-containing protein [Mangrovibacillus cuniculi]QPC46630.1 HD domain-containing protein [Mangrovibacillus cuniculi]
MNLMKDRLLMDVQKIAFESLRDDTTGHAMDHMNRVVQNALLIMKGMNVDEVVVLVSCYVHDCIDEKLVEDVEKASKQLERQLYSIGLSKEQVMQVMHIIRNLSFSKREISEPLSDEGKVVQDADRLDAIGAVGIARTFQYSGSKGNVLYDSTIPLPVEDREIGQNARHSTLHHFYDKLLLIKDNMNTKNGKKLAMERHKTLEQFLLQFMKEWNGVG